MFKRGLILCLFMFLPLGPAAAQEDIDSALQALDWKNERIAYPLPGSNSTYSLGADEALLLGDQAQRFLALTQGVDNWPDVVALVGTMDGPAAGSFIDIEYHEIGYLEDGDWKDVAPDGLLQDIIEATSETNKERADKGYATLEVVGWAEEPSYDKNRNRVYWATRLRDSDGYESINAVALKLGRRGYSRLTWTGDPQQFRDAKLALGPALRSYDYDPGFRYADFQTGDVVAAVGLGALAIGMMTGNKKGAAVGFAAAALLLLKKFWYFLLLPFAFVIRFFKRSES